MTKSSAKNPLISGLSNTTSYKAGVIQARANRLVKKLTDSILESYGITTLQWFTIGTVFDAGEDGISVSDLSRELGTNLPYVTNMVNALELRNILTRTSPKDNARLKLLHIHPGYVPQVPLIEAHVRKELRSSLYAGVSPQELSAYVNVLIRFDELLGPHDIR